MKIRTDFVTNSSSSSFSVSIVVEAEEKEFKVSFKPDEDGCGKADLACTAECILSVGSISELAALLRDSVYDEAAEKYDYDYDEDDEDEEDEDDEFSGMEKKYNEDMKYFADKLIAEIPSLDKIKRIRFSRHWDAWGEAASCLIWNENKLRRLAATVCNSTGADKRNAVEAMKKYLEEQEVFAYGGWQDAWPTGFMGAEGVGRYQWDGSIEELAKLIADGRISDKDDAEETTIIDMQKKTVEHTAAYKIKGCHGGELMFDTPHPSDMQYLSEDDESEEIVPRSGYPRIWPIEGTGFAGRTERIESLKVGDLVVLKEDYNAPPSIFSMNKDPVLRIEVFNKKNETLGYVSTYEPPYSIVKDLDRLGARVVSVTPRSARGPRARIALMDIELFIKNEDTDKEYARQEAEERQAEEQKRLEERRVEEQKRLEEERRAAERLRLQAEKEKILEARRLEKQCLKEARQVEQAERQRAEEQRRMEREKKRAEAQQRLQKEKAAKEERYLQLEKERRQNLFKNVIYMPGKEPENIRRRIDTLFKKLDDAYPNKQISRLQATHKKWAETVRELYRMLGYSDGQSFLEAYGYTVEQNKGGRPASYDYNAVIDELKRRYPNGSGLKEMRALVEENKDLPMKTLSNKATSLFGMSLKDYLKKLGIL